MAESSAPIAKVSTVFVPVSDQNQALAFYTEARLRDTDRCLLRGESALARGVAAGRGNDDRARSSARGTPGSRGSTSVGFGTDDVAATHADLREKGGR